MYLEFTSSETTQITKVVVSIFPNLRDSDVILLVSSLEKIFIILSIKLCIEENQFNDFKHNLFENNEMHIRVFLLGLLPFIDDKDNFDRYKKINDLTNISRKKVDYFTEDWENYLEISNFVISSNTFIDETYVENMTKLFMNTINTIKTKLFCNWINIVPYTLEDYKESKLYKDSFYYQENNLFVNIDNKQEKFFPLLYKIEETQHMIYYSGLSFEEMFDCVFVYMYNEIYGSGVKWLIYEKQEELNKKPITNLEIINSIVKLEHLLNFTFDFLESSKQKKSQEIWNGITRSNSEVFKNFIKVIIFKFDLSYYNDEIKEKCGYDNNYFYDNIRKKLGIKINDLEDEENFLDLSKVKISDDEYLKHKNYFIETVPFNIIYDFFFKSTTTFLNTWYGKSMLFEDIDGKFKINTIFEDEKSKLKIGNNTFFFTYKNLYNYAKFLSLDILKRDKNIKNSKNFGLNYKVFYDKLTETENSFRLGGVLNKTYLEWEEFRNKKDVYDFIKNNFRNNLKNLCFEILISIGLLNKFVLKHKITDKTYSKNDDYNTYVKNSLYDEYYRNKKIRNKYLETNYYLTREKFKKLELYDKKGKKEDYLYFLFKSTPFPWYNSFALTWSSQICFFHRYLYNRVMLITGSTGQGKSVIVPMMLHYASLALDLNSSTKVISTQPTIQPTINNALIMATNLGVPITINGIKTTNGYIQYSTGKDKHLVVNARTFIKEVTDRTLLVELIKNPYMKQRRKERGKYRYIDDNVYNVIIIDEAHMHNVSMDLIMTLIKSVLFINNSIKFIITSATMDNDEYIYRRYYKVIDNNLMYPLTFNTLNIDKNIVDKRYHISPPGETTRFVVNDYYNDTEPENYEESERIGIANLNKILLTSTEGHVLFFTTTNANIEKIVTEINKKSPKNVIALPLSSKLRESKGDYKWFDIIEKINKNFDKIIFKKEDILDVIKYGPDGFDTISPYSYNRAIIVATNVVEASVTIDGLKYVIDTGYQFNVEYDAESASVIAGVGMITEASRVQRRGRVGRNSSGSVYYSYKKDGRRNVPTRYDMVTQDITFDLLGIMTDNKTNKIFNLENHPMNYYFNKNNTKSFEELIGNETNETIKNIYRKQYYINAELNNLSFIKNNEHEKIDIVIPNEDGYNYKNLVDINANFFIIHPGENYIKRNFVSGKILFKNEETKKNVIDKKHTMKVESSFKNLILSKYIYEDSRDVENLKLYKFDYVNIIDEILDKHGNIIESLTKTTSELDVKFIIKTLLLSFIFENTDDVIKVISLMFNIENFNSFVTRKQGKEIGKSFPNFKEFQNMWLDNTSHLLSFLKIMNNFNDALEKTEIKETKNLTDVLHKKMIKLESLLKKHGNDIYFNNKLLGKDITNKDLETFITSKNRRKDLEDFKELYEHDKKQSNTEELNILSKCESFYIDESKMKNAIKTMNKLFILKEKIIEGKYDQQMKNKYPVSVSGVKNDDLILVFLESYIVKIFKNQGKNLINIFNLQKLDTKNFNMFNFYDSLFMIPIQNGKTMIGISNVSVELINKVFPIEYINIKESIVTNIDKNNIMAITRKISTDEDFTRLSDYLKDWYNNKI